MLTKSFASCYIEHAKCGAENLRGTSAAVQILSFTYDVSSLMLLLCGVDISFMQKYTYMFS